VHCNYAPHQATIITLSARRERSGSVRNGEEKASGAQGKGPGRPLSAFNAVAARRIVVQRAVFANFDDGIIAGQHWRAKKKNDKKDFHGF
jgi:hypothetical protein